MPKKKDKCVWEYGERYLDLLYAVITFYEWTTSCGVVFKVDGEKATFPFCPHCGKKIREVRR